VSIRNRLGSEQVRTRVFSSWASTPLEHWGVAGRAPKTRESRRRRRRGGWVWEGAVPLPSKFTNFSSQDGVIWCILGVLFLRFMCPMDCSCMINFTSASLFRWREKNKAFVKILGGRHHRTTPAGQILGGRDPCNPCGVDAYGSPGWPFPMLNINIFEKKIRKQFYQTALGNCYRLKLPKCWLQF